MKTVILLNNPSFGEKNYFAINAINEVIDKTNECVSLCSLNLGPAVVPIKSAVINPSELDSFKNGVMIALDTDAAKELIHVHTNSIKVLFLWELDWIGTQFNYRELADLLDNEDLIIFARTEEHKKIIYNMVKKEVQVIPEFNLEQIWNSLNDIKTK